MANAIISMHADGAPSSTGVVRHEARQVGCKRCPQAGVACRQQLFRVVVDCSLSGV